MSPVDFECPKCSSPVDMSGYPDHVEGGNKNNMTFDFTCDNCKHTFEVSYEYDIIYMPNEDTVTAP